MMIKLLLCLNFAVSIESIDSLGIDKSTLGNVRVLKIHKVENRGKSQDNFECAKKNDLQDEISLTYESAFQEFEVLKKSAFDIDQERIINKKFLCVDTAIFKI